MQEKCLPPLQAFFTYFLCCCGGLRRLQRVFATLISSETERHKQLRESVSINAFVSPVFAILAFVLFLPVNSGCFPLSSG